MWTMVVRFSTLATAAFLGGCAVTAPYVHEPRLMQNYYGSTPFTGADGIPQTQHKAKIEYAGDLPDAVDDANAQRQRYFDAAAQYGTLKSSAPLAAAALGIPALLLGIADAGSTNLRLGLGAGSAAAVGLATFYDNQPRQLVYLGGADAIRCAIVSQRPLLVPKTQYETMVTDITALRAATGQLATALGTIATLRANRLYDPDGARAVLTTALETLRSANEYKQLIDSAGFSLREKVISIVAAVDRELVKTDPDPRNIYRLLADIAPAAQGIAGNAIAGKTFAPSVLGQGFSSAPLDLDAATLATIHASGLVLSHLEAASASEASKALETCRPPEAQRTITLSPDEVRHDVATVPMTLAYTAFSGFGMPQATLAGAYPAGAFTILPPERASQSVGLQTTAGATVNILQLHVKVAENAKGHTATLTITDGSGFGQRQVTLRVAGEAAAALRPSGGSSSTGRQTGNGSSGGSTRSSDPANRLTEAERALVRREIGSGRDGAPPIDAQDSGPLKAYSESHGIPVSEGLSQAAYKAIVANARTKLPALLPDEVEKQLVTSGEALVVRSKCVPKEPLGDADARDPARVYTPAFRRTLFDLQRGLQERLTPPPPIEGRLNEPTYRHIISANRCTP